MLSGCLGQSVQHFTIVLGFWTAPITLRGIRSGKTMTLATDVKICLWSWPLTKVGVGSPAVTERVMKGWQKKTNTHTTTPARPPARPHARMPACPHARTHAKRNTTHQAHTDTPACFVGPLVTGSLLPRQLHPLQPASTRGSIHPNLCAGWPCIGQTRRRMARERKGAGSSLVSMETPYYKTID